MSSRKKTVLIVAFTSVLILFCLFFPVYKQGDVGWECNDDRTCNSPTAACLLEQPSNETVCIE